MSAWPARSRMRLPMVAKSRLNRAPCIAGRLAKRGLFALDLWHGSWSVMAPTIASRACRRDTKYEAREVDAQRPNRRPRQLVRNGVRMPSICSLFLVELAGTVCDVFGILLPPLDLPDVGDRANCDHQRGGRGDGDVLLRREPLLRRVISVRAKAGAFEDGAEHHLPPGTLDLGPSQEGLCQPSWLPVHGGPCVRDVSDLLGERGALPHALARDVCTFFSNS